MAGLTVDSGAFRQGQEAYVRVAVTRLRGRRCGRR